jgi:predicted peroxiredoxin
MSKYLLIASRDPFEAASTGEFYELAGSLAKAGNAVTLFLVQNGVLPARPGPHSGPLSKAAESGVQVLADEFSLRERGIHRDRLISGVKPASLEVVVDQLAEGRKAIWH